MKPIKRSPGTIVSSTLLVILMLLMLFVISRNIFAEQSSSLLATVPSTWNPDRLIRPDVTCAATVTTDGTPDPTAPPRVDVLFLLDSTGSMQPSIDGVKKTINAFVGAFQRFDMDVRIGLIAFRDRTAGEEPQMLWFNDQPFTANTNCFRDAVGKIVADGGGDTPESDLDALVLGARQPFRDQSNRRVLILITDAPPKIPDQSTQSINDTVAALRQARINFLYMFVTDDGKVAFEEIAAKSGLPGGLLPLMDARTGEVSFERLLPEIARKVSKQ